MNFKEEDHPPFESIAERLKRSKRISGSGKKSSISKVGKKNDEDLKRKSPVKPESTPGKKPRRGRPPKTEASSNSFNGSYLTPQELHHLFIKFKRDGHFHVTPPNVAPPPFVISRTSDGKSVTTKIECYEPFTMQRPENEVFGKTSDKTSVTFSTPLTEDPAKNLTSKRTNSGNLIPPTDKPTNADSNQFFLPKDEHFGQNWLDNRAQKTQNLLPNPYVNSAAGNRFWDNLAVPNINSKTSAAVNSQMNEIGRTCGSTDFSYSNSTRQSLLFRPYTVSKAPPSSTLVPLNQSAQETQKNSNTRGIHLPGNMHYDAPGGDQINRASRRNVKENTCPGLGVQSPPDPYNYSNLNGARNRSAFYQQKQNNAQNSTILLQNSTVPLQNSTLPLQNLTFPLQNSTVPVQSSTFPLQNSNVQLQNSIFPLQNSFNTGNEWNAANPSMMPNNGITYRPGNTNGSALTENMNSVHHSSYSAWNNDQWLPNSATIPPHYNCYNASNVQKSCETAERPIDVQESVRTQINSWSQNNQPLENTCETNSNVIRNNSNVSTITTSNDKESTEEAVFDIGGLQDPQNSVLCQTVSSSSYDDDISYSNYIGESISYNDANLEQAVQENEYSSKLPSIICSKTKMSSWYGGRNHYFENNYQPNDMGRLDSTSFETKNDEVDSSDCYLIEEPLKS